jgi:hypothetical protein
MRTSDTQAGQSNKYSRPVKFLGVGKKRGARSVCAIRITRKRAEVCARRMGCCCVNHCVYVAMDREPAAP